MICKKEQAEPWIKHPKNIHGVHQEDTVNIGYKWCLVSVSLKLKIQTCPRRHWKKKKIRKRGCSSIPQQHTETKYQKHMYENYKNIHMKITNMKNLLE